ncbi:SseB family protein [Microbacterium sp. CH-015]|uniref:SseB family protein n=1 Tax=Microbacterium sp. CH-015 TaxID=3406734 RepID=UPI003C707ECE
MGFFSRGKRTPADGVPPEAVPEAASDAVEETVDAHAGEEPVPHVGISVSTFGAPPPAAAAPAAPGALAESAAPAAPVRRPPATAPAPQPTVPGLVDNTLVQAALAGLPGKPRNTDIMNVMRQALQGQLFVRAQGDAQALLAAGQPLNLAITTFRDKRFLLAFSGGAALQASAQAEGAAAASVIGQPAIAVLRGAVTGGYDGIYLDHATPGARLVLPKPLIEKALDEGEPGFELKALLAGARGDATALQVAEALTRVKVWVAGGTDDQGRMGLAEARSSDGQRRLEVFSHPLEVIVLGRGDRPLPVLPEQLAKALASEPGLTGIVVDPGGPWIELDRDVLAPVLALAG